MEDLVAVLVRSSVVVLVGDAMKVVLLRAARNRRTYSNYIVGSCGHLHDRFCGTYLKFFI